MLICIYEVSGGSHIKNSKGLWFAILDGAQLDDAILALKATPLRHEPLYIGLNDKPDQQKTAPFMVWLNRTETPDSQPDEALLRMFFDVAGKPSSCAFWRCDQGGDVLYKHLRSINKIIIPEEKDGNVSQSKTETVLFRHADANVLAQVVPALNIAELSRMLGPANYILFRADSEWADGIMYAQRIEAMPEPANGMLQLSPETYEKIIANRYNGIIRKIEKYLYKVVPEPRPDAKGMRQIALNSFIAAKKNGIKTEAGFYRWAFLYYKSKGEFAKAPPVRAVLDDQTMDLTPDVRIKLIMKESIRQIQKLKQKQGVQ